MDKSLPEGTPSTRGSLAITPPVSYRSLITAYNEDAALLWGRRPDPGSDRWCGAYQSWPEKGTVLPHQRSPVAIVVQETRQKQTARVIIERPDRTRRIVIQQVKPIHAENGAVTAAVSILSSTR